MVYQVALVAFSWCSKQLTNNPPLKGAKVLRVLLQLVLLQTALLKLPSEEDEEVARSDSRNDIDVRIHQSGRRRTTRTRTTRMEKRPTKVFADSVK